MSRKAKGPGLLHGGTGLRKGQPHVSTAGTQFLPGGCLQTQHPAFSDGLCLMEGVETAKTDDWETLSSGQTSKPGTHCREWRKDYTERAKEYDFFFLSGLWDQRSCCRWFRCFAFSVMGLLFFPGPDVFTVVSIDRMFEYPLSNSDVEEHSPNVRGLGGVVSGTWLCHEGGAFPPPPEKDTASRGGPLQTPNHFDLGLPASKAVRSTFCCFQVSQFMVLLLSQPRQAETVVLFLCISNGVPPTYIHTHTHTHTHTPLSQWCRHPTQIKDRRPGWNERQITQGVSTPLENPGKQTSDYVVCALTMWYSRWENHFLIKVMETQSLWHLKLDCTKL